MADRWAVGKATTRRTRARRVISPSLPFWRKPENTSGASCAMAIGRRASRSRHLESVFAALPQCIVKIFARADAGFYCWEAVQAYEKGQASFILVARKTTRLLAELQSARWQPSPRTPPLPLAILQTCSKDRLLQITVYYFT